MGVVFMAGEACLRPACRWKHFLLGLAEVGSVLRADGMGGQEMRGQRSEIWGTWMAQTQLGQERRRRDGGMGRAEPTKGFAMWDRGQGVLV